VNASAGTVWNVCAWSALGKPMIKANAIATKKTRNETDSETRLLI
jgi:hypothetical protein